MHWQNTIPSKAANTTASPSQTPSPTYTLAGRTIDLDALEIRTNTEQDKTVHLTLMEAELLRYLLDHPRKIVARKELLENVWHVKEDTDTRAIDNFVVRLRRYLEPDPSKPIHLLTIRGVGYRFIPDPE
jgi:DNA-binding response OmpR family regulator